MLLNLYAFDTGHMHNRRDNESENAPKLPPSTFKHVKG